MAHCLTRDRINEILEMGKEQRRKELENELQQAEDAINNNDEFIVNDKNTSKLLTINTPEKFKKYRNNAEALLDLLDERDAKAKYLYCPMT